ncbi:MAG: hypothetical protein IJK06_08310 [Clostridia bacterium]|nr:hypothetical protein [Clostridia bacterium]
MRQQNKKDLKSRTKVSAIKKEPEWVFCLSIYIVLFFALFYLFINQARGFCVSDFPAHISAAKNGKGYSITNVFLYLSNKVAGNIGCAAYLASVVLITMFLSGIILKTYLDSELTTGEYGWAKTFLTASALFFIGGIYVPNIYPYFYLAQNYTGPGSAGSICTQPWHNPTYQLMRLFGIATLFFFFKIRSQYLVKGIKIKDWLLFFISLTLTNAAKPNFFIAFAPAMLIFLIYDFIRQRGKGFFRMVYFGAGVLCSMPVLFIQKSILFPEDVAKINNTEQVYGIEFSTSVIQKMWREGTVMPYLVTGLLFFVIITILCVINHRIDQRIIFGWLMLIIAILEFWFVTETGPRAAAGNFGWGIPFCAFALANICIERLILLKSHISPKVFPFIITPLVCMFITGIVYFAYALTGGDFNI